MTTEIEILQFLHYHPLSKRSDILPSLSKQISDRTLMRLLSEATANGHIEVVGRGPANSQQWHFDSQWILSYLVPHCGFNRL